LGFLNPIFLFGILAAAVPLIIHLWSRRQAKTVDFSSLMFLLVAHRQSVRRIQLKHLLILLLRMAILILIALALARPLLKNQFSFAGARARTSSVVILDNSYSMAYQGIEGNRFEKAREMALDVVQSLRRGDGAALILMSDIPDAVFRKLTKDLDGVKVAIGQSEVSARSTLVPPSLELAHDILDESNDPNKEIYLISDFGRNGWENWGRVPNRSGARIFLLSVGDEAADNTSIEEVRISNQLIGTHLPLQLQVNVTNHSDAPSEEMTLTLFIDGQKRRSVSFRAMAHESVASTFTHKFESPGTHIGSLELTADRLNADNRRYFAFHAYGQIRALCVGEQTVYLTLALNPEVQQAPSTAYTILPVSCSAQEFENFALEDYDVILFADVTQLSDQSRQQLQNFIRDGKSVIYFVDDRVDAASYNRFADWLPANFGATKGWNPPLTLAEYPPDHPIFEPFKPDDFSGQYAPQFYRGRTIDAAEGASVVAKLSDGTPFLIERSIDAGTTLLFNVSATRLEGASNLLVNPHFLPLIQQAVLYTKAIQSRSQRNLSVGQTYTANYRQSRGARVTVVRVGAATDTPEIASVAEDGSLTFGGTEIPGIYQTDVQNRDQLVRDFFAVNVDTTEADLQQIPLSEAGDRVGSQVEMTSSTQELDESLNVYRMGKEIWGELLALALICMLIEGFLSNHERVVPDESVIG
jgi:hypothetical protein